MQTNLQETIRTIVAEEIGRALGQPTSDHPQVMNAEGAAAFLGVDRKTIYDYAHRGEIPHQRLGKRMLFSRDALLHWLGRSADDSER